MFGRVQTFGVGDGPNDFSMLKAVDKPFFIKKVTVNPRFNAWTGILNILAQKQLSSLIYN